MQNDGGRHGSDDAQHPHVGARASVSSRLERLIGKAIVAEGGFLPFDRFMAFALYAPGLGYYATASRPFGTLPSSGSDFVTAPELSPWFGRALARQVSQALRALPGSARREIWEFGAGSGALADQLLAALAVGGDEVSRYTIVEVSSALRERQQAALAHHGARVQWVSELPPTIDGVVVGNEVLDAMPVQLLGFDGSAWHERGVAIHDGRFRWADRPTALQPPQADGFAAGAVTEIHAQADAFIATIAERLRHGGAFFIDYGFPEAEYYHPQRSGGTLMCHRAHVADTDPLVDVGQKDITAHVDFSAIALAGQDAGMDVIGYTSQARFLMNCGLLDLLEGAPLKDRIDAQKLVTEHEMGELFKVIAFAKGVGAFSPMGFSTGDRTHTL